MYFGLEKLKEYWLMFWNWLKQVMLWIWNWLKKIAIWFWNWLKSGWDVFNMMRDRNAQKPKRRKKSKK